ncbi:MAG: site-specific integrase [Pirellula sp.]
MRNEMRVLHDSIRTESAYVDWIVRFLRFYRTPNGTWRHPAELRGPEISAFLTYLAVDRQVSASTQNQALSAIVLLYRQVLELDPGLLDGVLATQRKPPAVAIVVDRRFP